MSNHNLFKRGNIWWFCVVSHGEKRRESLRTSDIKIARRLRDEKLEAINESKIPSNSPLWRVAVVEWAEHVRGQIGAETEKRYAVSFRQCEPYIGNLRLSQIDKAKLADMVKRRRATGASVATIRRDLTAISVVLDYAQAHMSHDSNPTLGLRKSLKERRDPIELPERASIEKVVAAATQRFGALIRAAELTGCRIDELVTAKWRGLDEDAATLRVIGKGNKSRTIDLSGPALTHIRTQPTKGRGQLIFCSDEGEPFSSPSSNFGRICRSLAKRDKSFKRFRLHDLRHLYAVTALLGGMDIWTVSRQLGHGSVQVTESVYLKFLSAEQAEAARKPSTHSRTQLQRFAEGEKI